MAYLDYRWQDRTLPDYERIDAVNELYDLRFAIYAAEHPWMAMGVPRGYTPGLGGTSGYENAAILALGAASAVRSLCPPNVPSPGQLGREGEALASEISGFGKNTQSYVVNGRTRTPDQVLRRDIATGRPVHISERLKTSSTNPERSQIFRGSYREVQVVFQGDE
jgi:hypothetical protein